MFIICTHHYPDKCQHIEAKWNGINFADRISNYFVWPNYDILPPLPYTHIAIMMSAYDLATPVIYAHYNSDVRIWPCHPCHIRTLQKWCPHMTLPPLLHTHITLVMSGYDPATPAIYAHCNNDVRIWPCHPVTIVMSGYGPATPAIYAHCNNDARIWPCHPCHKCTLQ